MSGVVLELPPQRRQTAFNLRRWTELLADPILAKIDARIETDRYGHIVTAPPPAPQHGSFQSEIAYQLRHLMSTGRVLTECPISTADGVKASDVAWASPNRMKELGHRTCFPIAPEICVEVVSPENTNTEMAEKRALYFDAGAKEVWICEPTGAMTVHGARSTRSLRASELCPGFPKRIELR